MTAFVRLSVLAVLAAVLAASPAAADEVLTYQITGNPPYDIGGQLSYDLTSNSLLRPDVYLITPSGDIDASLGEFYVCCGSQGASVFFFYTPAAVIPGLPTIDGFSFETGLPLNVVEQLGYNYGIGSGEYLLLSGGATQPYYGAALTLVSETGIPEPPSIWLLVSGLILIFFAGQLRAD